MSGLTYGLIGDGVKQAFLEAETSVNTYAPPDLIKHSPGVAKAYGRVNGSGTLQSGSHNCASGAQDDTGNFTISWTTDFSGTTYTVVCIGESTAISAVTIMTDSYATGSVGINIWNTSNARADEQFSAVAFGDQ